MEDWRVDFSLYGLLVEFDGVVFDDVHEEGILLRSLRQRRGWRNVFFGPDNADEPKALFARFRGVQSEMNIVAGPMARGM